MILMIQRVIMNLMRKKGYNRIKFRLKKVEELRKMAKCDICDYTTKLEVGLKSHKTKKYKGT